MKRFLLTFVFAFSILFFVKVDSSAYELHYTGSSVYSTTDGFPCAIFINDSYVGVVLDSDGNNISSTAIVYNEKGNIFTFRGTANVSVGGSRKCLFQNPISSDWDSIFPKFNSISDALVAYRESQSSYVPEIGAGRGFYHLSLFGLNDTTEIVRSILLGTDINTNPDTYKYTLYVNNVQKDTGVFSDPLNFSHSFKHSQFGIVSGDQIKFVVVPYHDGDYGNAHELSWTARTGILKDNQNPIVDSPFVDVDINIPIDNSTNYNFPVDISSTKVTVYQGISSTVISSSNSYSQNVDVSKHEEVTNEVIQYIENNNNYFYGDDPEDIVINNTTNKNYNFNFDFDIDIDISGNNPIGTFNSTKGYLSEWSDQVLDLIAPLNQSVFKPLFIAVTTVVGVVIGFALVAVFFKFIGLFL